MKPTRKVGSGLLAGALTSIAVWALDQFAGVQIPAEIAAAITTVLAFAVSWLVPEANGGGA